MNEGSYRGFRIAIATVLCLTWLLGANTSVSARNSELGSLALEVNSDPHLRATQGVQWERVEPEPSFSHAFVQAVRPQIQAAITGAYGGTPLYENAKVIEVRRLKNDPTVVDIDIRVETFVGAHNRLGTVTITFRVAGNQFNVGEVKVVKQR